MNVFVDSLNFSCISISIEIGLVTIRKQFIFDIIKEIESSVSQIGFLLQSFCTCDDMITHSPEEIIWESVDHETLDGSESGTQEKHV